MPLSCSIDSHTHIHSPTHSAISDAGESATGWDNQQTSVIFKESIYYIAVILTLRGQLWISLYYFIFLHFGRGLYQAFFFFLDLGLSRWIVAFTRPTLPFHFKQNLHFKLLSLPCGHTPSIINEKSSVMKLFLSWLLFFILSFFNTYLSVCWCETYRTQINFPDADWRVIMWCWFVRSVCGCGWLSQEHRTRQIYQWHHTMIPQCCLMSRFALNLEVGKARIFLTRFIDW